MKVKQGELFAFLGSNGAGKSTTIEILCTLLKYDSREIEIDGHTLGKQDKDISKKIGVVFQSEVLDGNLTVKENLIIRGGMYDLKNSEIHSRIKSIDKYLDIQDFMNQRYRNSSGGQRRRADISI